MNSRRSFMWRFGAGASAAVASVAGVARGEAPKQDDAARRLALLQEENALRQFHRAFELAVDNGLHEEVIGMFAVDAEVVFNGGVYCQRDHGVRRLYAEHFPSGKIGKRMEQAPGFELRADQQGDSMVIAADLRSAKAVFPYSIQAGAAVETESSLAAMARLHGEGVKTWWEGGQYRVDYRKDAAGAWRISRLEYNTLSRADWRTGKREARPIEVARLSTLFPQDRQGPDALI